METKNIKLYMLPTEYTSFEREQIRKKEAEILNKSKIVVSNQELFREKINFNTSLPTDPNNELQLEQYLSKEKYLKI